MNLVSASEQDKGRPEGLDEVGRMETVQGRFVPSLDLALPERGEDKGGKELSAGLLSLEEKLCGLMVLGIEISRTYLEIRV